MSASAQTSTNIFEPIPDDPPKKADKAVRTPDAASPAPAPAPAAAADPAIPKPAETGVSFTSAVNVIRRGDRTEVMFQNGEMYYLPTGGRYAGFYDACDESANTGKTVTATVDPETRIIQKLTLGTAPAAAKKPASLLPGL